MDAFFTHIPTGSQGAIGGTSTTLPAPVNAQAINVPKVLANSFLAAQKQAGPIRGEVVRQNKNGTLSVRTADGDIDVKVKPSNSSAQNNVTQGQSQNASQSSTNTAAIQQNFKAGDAIRLHVSLDQSINQAQASSAASKSLTLDLKITPDLSSGREGQAVTYNRTSETPLNIKLQPQPNSTNTAPISARLEPVVPGEAERLLAQISAKNNLNVELQNTVFQNKSIIDTTSTTIQKPAHSVSPIALIKAQTDALGVRTDFSPPIAQGAQGEAAIPGQSQGISKPSQLSQQPIPSSATTNNATALQPLGTKFTPETNTIKTNIFNILNNTPKTEPPILAAPQSSVQSTAAPISAPPLDVTQRAGYVTAQVVGFTADGSTIVRLPTSHAQVPGQITAQPPSGVTSSASTSSATATPSLNIWSTHNVAGGDLFLLRAPELNSAPLPVGAQIELAPQVQTQSSSAALGGTNFQTNPLPYFMSPGVWPALSESYQTLQMQAPALAQAMSNIVAQPAGGANATANIMPAALFFLSAIRSGDIHGWLGDKVMDGLKRLGKGELAGRLGQEGQALGRLNAEPLSQDWRAISLPFLDQGEIHKVALYYKQGEPDDEGGDGEKRTRFVFDMALSRMGQVQVDGLFQGKKLDLMLRTPEDLSPNMRHTMRGMYTNALEASGLNGSLSFQNGMRHYFTPKPQVDEFEAEF